MPSREKSSRLSYPKRFSRSLAESNWTQVLREAEETLNPEFWTREGDKWVLKDEVREHLLMIATEFSQTLEMPDLNILDIYFLGSMAGFNWTNHSDCDLHLIVQRDSFESCDIPSDEYFAAKQSVWNKNHEITIYGHPVEVYVQMDDEVNHSTGVYSVVKNQWVEEPEIIAGVPTVDNPEVRIKAAKLAHQIDALVTAEGSPEDVERLKEKLNNFRQSGLDAHGEFSIENLAYKLLRREGYLEKLSQYKVAKMDKNMSLK